MAEPKEGYNSGIQRVVSSGAIDSDGNYVADGAAHVVNGSGTTVTIAGAVTSVNTEDAVAVTSSQKSIEALLTGMGAISADIDVYGAHTDRNTNGTLIGSLAPNGTTTAQDSFVSDVPYPYLYADITAISGTGASVNVTVAS